VLLRSQCHRANASPIIRAFKEVMSGPLPTLIATGHWYAFVLETAILGGVVMLVLRGRGRRR
jgi:hypothetical protein